MSKKFQAKEIQKLLGIQKFRYEYVKTKFAITPEDEDDIGDGRGKVHRYSFKNLLQFAFLHHAIQLGLTPKAAKDILFRLSKDDAKTIYDPEKKIECLVYSASVWEIKCIRIEGDFIAEIYDSRGYTDVQMKQYQNIHNYNTDQILSEASGYVLLNIGLIKSKIMDNLTG